METTFYSLASKNNFNKALRHFFKVNDVVEDIESRHNLADIINGMIDEKDIHPDQVLPIVGSVIRDKFAYSYSSYILPHSLNEFDKIVKESAKWTALDIVLVYYSPGGKVLLINPKNSDHWGRVKDIIQDQLLVIYAKFIKEEDVKTEAEAIKTLQEMIAGKDVFVNKNFIDSTIVPKAPPVKKAEPAAVSESKHATPKYGVQVSNELFHNGNVEAWKKIVESYHQKFEECRINIFFEGEVINDINSLFKWGKVKHSDLIFFQVVGENIKGVSKLKKYLFEGASPRYEQFLKVGVGKVLNIF